ncbi:hypothetical protein JYU34_006717 [Plutella xylostella]|uniref:Sulfatase N-terminal domain-containing protein n=1 Tax=Plutella xylostella TaxID=51655 RepID=A0ABQ7QSP1_PLUXY|nr:hypothetical protein JYU34_006717 [Plutella xylostella]
MLYKWARWFPAVVWLATVAAQQPHVVFIMVDDMGWNDVSFHGSDQIQTPNIDTLAYKGVILQQYYSEAICTPARTALLTGKYPMRLGMHGFPLYNSEDRGIPLTERLLPSYLKELGYATHLVGKWHVGMSRDEFLPTNRGYDTHYGMRGGYVDYYTYNKIETWPDGRTMFGLDLFDGFKAQDKEQRYLGDALTDRAINIIRRHNASQPLFLHLAHNAPHAGNSGGALQPPLYTTVKNRHIANSDRRLYADIVTHLDRCVGQVVRALADKNILDNTIIIFASDNGAPTVGPLGNWGINLPFRGKKQTPWEGGVRVPALIWHSSIKPGVWDGLMHITDWLPTLTAAAGGDAIKKPIDGVNQWNSIIAHSQSPRKEVLISVEDSETTMYAAYRAGDYKIVVGNVTGVSNGYYGAEFMINKKTPPDYYSVLKDCEVANVLQTLGLHLDKQEVEELRLAARVKQLDGVRNATPCEPTPSRGCLYNVRRDPMEAHDLWDQARRIASLLTSRLQELWAQANKRGPTALKAEADPANFDYTWLPWLSEPKDYDYNDINSILNQRRGRAGLPANLNERSGEVKYSGLRSSSVCEGTSGIRQFICVLQNVF